MKRFKLYSLLIFSATLLMFSCGDDDEEMVTDFAYTSEISSPSVDDKNVNDMIHIHVDFASATQQTVHHVNVKIYNVDDETNIILNEPADAHVHEEDGTFTFERDFMLSNDNGVEAHSDWIMETKVWGDGAGVGEVVETIQFHVHPE